MPLASGWLDFFGVLIIFFIALLIIGASIASTLGPIALVIATIIKLFRNSTRINSAGTGLPGIGITTSPGTRVVSVDPTSSFGQAFSATLQGGLGGQLGKTLAQMINMAAEQHPLELQLAPMVMAIEAARRQGNVSSVRPFLTEGFASRFPTASPAGIAHIELASAGAIVTGDHVVIRIDRGTLVHSEYWTFRRDASALPEGTPVACPRCGAPTAGDRGGTCRFCGAVFSTAAPALPQPARWLLDDISTTPPALAA